MEKNLKLTKTSDSDLNLLQCQHNNKGYCKFGLQCRYQHYNEICEKKICRTKECPARHPKACKNAQNCKFHKNNCCAYRHDEVEKEEKEKLSDKFKESLEEVKILQAEIHDLKDRIKRKEDELEARMAEEVEKEKRIEELSEKLETLSGVNKALKADNEVLLERISFKHSELEKIKTDFDCEKCDCKINTKSDFQVHINSNHSEQHEENFKYKFCDLIFKKEFDLNIHKLSKAHC